MFTLEDVKPENRPKFLVSCNFSEDNPSMRAYIHGSVNQRQIGKAIYHLGEYCKITNRVLQQKKFDWILSIFWKDQENYMMDILAYKLSQNGWPVNAEPFPWIMENGVLRKNDGSPTCEDGIILLGQEAIYRRTTSSLAEYMRKSPIIHELGINKENLIHSVKKGF